ncbi:C-type mannose receptor 2-like [Mercenaria mercenaria]|uniref:C-type mannose receptor 2-like n=1 Tax=Mercenaria mercenaria TaxID=6596 RepID=UPI00234E4CA6|nr:C-type mannose receptor 2-like [Mercenaria mercenaria]
MPCHCDDGWEKFGGSCYLFNINPLSWEQAKTTCTDLGSNLLKVEDAAENEFAKAKCAEYGAYYYWIGARYYAQYGEYRWYDGTAIIYNDWSQGQPDTINGCVDLLDHFDWKWNDHSDCFTTYGGSICEKECDVGWGKFDGRCYKFNTNLLSWEQAKVTCTDLGANLLKVEDATENDFARAKCAEYGATHYWIGARYYAQFGEYRWYDGTTISYNDWYPGEPDIISGCVDMLDIYNWHWNDHPDCSTSYGGSICEKGLFD